MGKARFSEKEPPVKEKGVKMEPPRPSKGSREVKKRDPGQGRENEDFFTFFLTDKKRENGCPAAGGRPL